MSRVVDRRFIFGEAEFEYFHRVMRGLEAFSGIRVVTYCLMSNHFHLLLEIPSEEDLPPEEEVSDAEFDHSVSELPCFASPTSSVLIVPQGVISFTLLP